MHPKLLIEEHPHTKYELLLDKNFHKKAGTRKKKKKSVKNSVVSREEHCSDMLHPNFSTMKKNGDNLINLGDSLNLLKNNSAIDR
jgi:hypothetical protein